jgi:soluble lytic murein transglycosylase-like protein
MRVIIILLLLILNISANPYISKNTMNIVYKRAQAEKNEREDKYDDIIKEWSDYYGLPDWLLIKAQIWTESKFKEKAISPVGATGLMQFMPSTFKNVYVGYLKKEEAILDPDISIASGCKLMKTLWTYSNIRNVYPSFPDRWFVATKQYNASPRNMTRLVNILKRDLKKDSFSFQEIQDNHHKLITEYEYKKVYYIENYFYPLNILYRYNFYKKEGN